MNALPRWLEKVLRAICPDELYEQIEGDLLEIYNHEVKTSGQRMAGRRLLWNALRFCRPGIVMRNKFSAKQSHLPMLRNYLITSVRHIRKSKVNFTFKLGGLSLAIFSFLGLAVHVSYQLSYDTHHHDYQHVYRVNSDRLENGVLERYAIVPLALGPVLKQNLAEVTDFARTRYRNGSYLRHEGKVVDCEGLLEADSSLLHVLKFDFIEGNADALKEPNAIVLTRPRAEALFGEESALKKMVSINNEKQLYQVTAVIEDPAHTAFNFEALVLNTTERELTAGDILSSVEYLDNSATLFVRLNAPPSEAFAAKVNGILERFLKKETLATTGFAIHFQPVDDIFLGPQLAAEFAGKGNPVYVYAFSILGVLLLVVASINYINLSIADFSRRMRETGVRRVLGAQRHQLQIQVMLETMVLSLLATGIAVFLLYLFFPQVLSLLDSELRFGMLLDRKLLGFLAVAWVALVFLSFWFPARQFTGGSVSMKLKSSGGSYNSGISQVLLFTQFTISALCIACTLVAARQVEFIHNKDLGIDRKNLLVFSLPEDFSLNKLKALKVRLKEIHGVTHVSNSSFRIGGGYWKDWYTVEGDHGFRNVELYEVFSDDELFATLGIKLLEGRTFDAQIPYDSGAAFVINETAARELGWKDPIGKRIYTHPEEKGKWDGTVVGVVADVNISPLYDRIRPLVMRLPWQSQNPDYFVYVRYDGDEKRVVEAITKTYQEVNPGYPFEFRFVDEFYNTRHRKESKAYASLQLSTGIIVVVSMLGIFSMAAFISVRRMKEFGIRKVMGASVTQIFTLHMNYFIRLMLLSNLIALPVGYWLVKNWLETFAYRIDISPWPFLIVGLLSLVLVIVSGSFSAWKSGRMNPVDVIKIE